MPTVLSREQIQVVDDRKIEFVPIPEWGDGPDIGLFVRGLSGTDRDSFEMAMIDQKKGNKQVVNLVNLRAKLVVRCAVDSDDPDVAKTVFQLTDVEWLGRKSAQALQRVYSVAQRLSGLSNEDVDELTKELGEDSSDGSGSGSPLSSATDPSQSVSNPSAVESLPNGSPTIDSSPLAIEG